MGTGRFDAASSSLDRPDWSSVETFAELVGQWSPDALVLVDPDCRVRYASRSIERVLGFGEQDELGTAMWDFVHPDDLIAATGALNAATRTVGYQHPAEFRIRHARGGWVDCEVNGNAVGGPNGSWVILSIRATRDRDQIIGRRRSIEQLIRMASLECSAVRWDEVDRVVERFLRDLAEIVGAEVVELAWEEEHDDLRVGARWPAVRSGPAASSQRSPFVPLWPLEESAAMLLRSSSHLSELEPSEVRDRFLRLQTRAVVEVPLSARAPWAVVRLCFGGEWFRWSDANVDLVIVLATTLMATLRRCLAEEHVQKQARTDPLTGLMNRAELYQRFEALLVRRDRGSRAADDDDLGVLYCDLDLFKQVNDRFGHASGDRLLVDVAAALRESVRDVDMVARFGGDEFVVVCPQLSGADALEPIKARIAEAVGRLDAHGIPVRMSIGGAIAAPGLGSDEVVKLADEAMYRAKRRGQRQRRR